MEEALQFKEKNKPQKGIVRAEKIMEKGAFSKSVQKNVLQGQPSSPESTNEKIRRNGFELFRGKGKVQSGFGLESVILRPRPLLFLHREAVVGGHERFSKLFCFSK